MIINHDNFIMVITYNNTIYDYLVAKSDLNKVIGKE